MQKEEEAVNYKLLLGSNLRLAVVYVCVCVCRCVCVAYALVSVYHVVNLSGGLGSEFPIPISSVTA